MNEALFRDPQLFCFHLTKDNIKINVPVTAKTNLSGIPDNNAYSYRNESRTQSTCFHWQIP